MSTIQILLYVFGFSFAACAAWFILIYLVCLFGRSTVEDIIKIPVGFKASTSRNQLERHFANEHNQQRRQYSVRDIRTVVDEDMNLADVLKFRMMMNECKQAAQKARIKKQPDILAENQKRYKESRDALEYVLTEYLQELRTLDE